MIIAGITVSQLGLVPSQKEAVISTNDGKINLSFEKSKPAYLLCKLRRAGMGDAELERCISENYTENRIDIAATLPKHGEYGLEIYGNDPAKDGDTYTHICQYFVHYASPDEQARAFYQEAPQRKMVPHAQKAYMTNYNPDQVRYIHS